MRKPRTPGYMVCLQPYGGHLKTYVSRWGPYLTLADALTWAQRSGLSPWTGEAATRAGYGPEGRLGRVWIEREGQPATK